MKNTSKNNKIFLSKKFSDKNTIKFFISFFFRHIRYTKFNQPTLVKIALVFLSALFTNN
jgi:hypothetical protein